MCIVGDGSVSSRLFCVGIFVLPLIFEKGKRLDQDQCNLMTNTRDTHLKFNSKKLLKSYHETPKRKEMVFQSSTFRGEVEKNWWVYFLLK